MQSRTRNSLLGYGLTAELIDLVAAKGHTVALLKAMTASHLTDAYGSAHAAVIADRLRRKPIDDAVVDAIIAEADGCCCLCVDGNSARPYEIHHIDEYADTQDNSKANLLLVCPTHHKVIDDQGISKAEQRELRSSWHALVRIARDYRDRGLSFPYALFAPISYESPASIEDLVEFVRVSPSTSSLVCPAEIVDEALANGTTANMTVIQGRSGAGKSTVALAVGGRLAGQGRRMYRYRPSPEPRAALGEVMTFLRAASHPVGLILDDANSYCTRAELLELASAAKGQVHLIVVWTPADRDENDRGILTGGYVTVTWQDIQPTLKTLLLQHELTVVDVLGRLSPQNGIDAVGMSGLRESLEYRIDRYSATAKTVSEFLFLLRGENAVVDRILRSLHERDQSDGPILCAAAEQIAGFERPVSPAETANVLKSLASYPQSPAPTAEWIVQVFLRETRARHIVERRGMFTTVHRDWAKVLLAAGLRNDATREVTRELVRREFDVASSEPERMSAMWSWLWSAGGAGSQFVLDWASGLDRDQWTTLVRRSAEKGITSVGFFAGRMHILLHGQRWTETVAAAMEANERELVSCLVAAKPEDWYYINELFMAVNHAAPALGDRLREAWGPSRVASLFMSADPQDMHRVYWCFANVRERHGEWCREVCEHLEWPKVVENFKRIRPGALQDVCETWGALENLGFPMRRTMLRTCVDAMCGAIATAELKDVRLHVLGGLMLVLWVYPDETDRIFASIDNQRWASELALSQPRHWEHLDWVSSLAMPRSSDYVWRPLELVDVDTFAKTIALYAPHAPHPFRCLVWLFRFSTKATRERLATAIEQTAEKVMREAEEERNEIARAFLSLSPRRAELLIAKLRADGLAVDPKPPPEEKDEESFKTTIEMLRERDRKGEDYLVRDAIGDEEATGER